MAARMKVEDRCCKSKAVPGYDLFRPKRTAVTIHSSFFLTFFSFFSGEAKDERFGAGGGGLFTKWKRAEEQGIWEGKKERGVECGIGVVKAASFLDIIYLSAVGPEEREGGRK